eukprot:7370783-Prymnesium_polylepis.2
MSLPTAVVAPYTSLVLGQSNTRCPCQMAVGSSSQRATPYVSRRVRLSIQAFRTLARRAVWGAQRQDTRRGRSLRLPGEWAQNRTVLLFNAIRPFGYCTASPAGLTYRAPFAVCCAFAVLLGTVVLRRQHSQFRVVPVSISQSLARANA